MVNIVISHTCAYTYICIKKDFHFWYKNYFTWYLSSLKIAKRNEQLFWGICICHPAEDIFGSWHVYADLPTRERPAKYKDNEDGTAREEKRRRERSTNAGMRVLCPFYGVLSVVPLLSRACCPPRYHLLLSAPRDESPSATIITDFVTNDCLKQYTRFVSVCTAKSWFFVVTTDLVFALLKHAPRLLYVVVTIVVLVESQWISRWKRNWLQLAIKLLSRLYCFVHDTLSICTIL